MKTAMQELIEHLRDNDYHVPIKVNLILEELLEKEKEQLIKAHIDGFDHIVVDFKKQEFAEQYYNQTYKPETI